MITQRSTCRIAIAAMLFIQCHFVVNTSAQHNRNLSSTEIDRLFLKTLRNKTMSADSLLLVGSRIKSESENSDYSLGIIRGKILLGLGNLSDLQLDSAAHYFLQAINEAESLGNDSFEEGLGHNYLGSVFTRLNNHPRALLQFLESARIFREVENVEYLAVSLSNAGTAHGAQDDYPKALEYFLEAQKLADDLSVTDNQRANILSNISVVYSLMGKKPEALRYAKAALNLDRLTSNLLGICQSYNAIGNIYKEHQQYDSALYFYDRTLAVSERGEMKFNAVSLRALQNKADVYTRQNKINEAANLFRQILKSDDVYQREEIYNYLSQYYVRLNKPDSAIYFSHKALGHARQSKAKAAVNAAHRQLQEIYLKKKNMDSAYFYLAEFHALSDSIFNETNRSRFDNLRIQLETLEKEREIALVTKQAELRKAQNTTFRVLLVAASLVFVLLFFSMVLFYKNRQKKHQLQTLALKEEIQKRNSDLQNQALRMIHMSNGLKELEESLKKVRSETSSAEVQHVLKTISVNRSMEKEWESFNEYFGNRHSGFYEKLDSYLPQITITEKRLAGLVRMNLTNREIAGILNIEDTSVKIAKYRLKKRLVLPDEMNLYSFLAQLTNEKPSSPIEEEE